MGLNQKQHNKHILFLRAEMTLQLDCLGSFKIKHEQYERCEQSNFTAQQISACDTATEDIKESTQGVLVAFGASLFTSLFIKHKLEMGL